MMQPKRALLFPVLTLLTMVLPARGQAGAGTSSAKPLPVYDVSTVRVNKSGTDNVHISMRKETFYAENISLKSLLQFAFGIRRDLIFGLPGWGDSARYDLSAKVTEPDDAQLKALTEQQRSAMLRAVLESRFALKWHYDTKVVPVYELVVGKSGPTLKTNPDDGHNVGTSMNNTDLTGTDVQMAGLADILSDHLERPVVDKTGLTARYDFRLRWTPDGETAADNGQGTEAPPPLFTAIQEQLGLKLQPGKDAVRTLVIDKIDMPSEN